MQSWKQIIFGVTSKLLPSPVRASVKPAHPMRNFICEETSLVGATSLPETTVQIGSSRQNANNSTWPQHYPWKQVVACEDFIKIIHTSPCSLSGQSLLLPSSSAPYSRNWSIDPEFGEWRWATFLSMEANIHKHKHGHGQGPYALTPTCNIGSTRHGAALTDQVAFPVWSLPTTRKTQVQAPHQYGLYV